MILTVTPTPVLHRRTHAGGPVNVGEVNSLVDVQVHPAGAGVSVANGLYVAGYLTKALFPAPEVSHYVRLIRLQGLPHEFVPTTAGVTTQVTVTDPNGVVTTFADPPMAMDTAQLAMLRDLTIRSAEEASWVALCGPLPKVASAGWYVEVERALRLYHPQAKILVAASGPGLTAVFRQLAAVNPDAVAIAAADWEEHGGLDAGSVASAAKNASPGSLREVLAPAKPLLTNGVSEILITVSPRQAILITREGFILARSNRTGEVASHWRDFAVAGYLAAHDDGLTAQRRLTLAVAFASAQGDSPTPDLVDRKGIQLTEYPM